MKKLNEQNIKVVSELKNENKKIKEENEDLKNKKKEIEYILFYYFIIICLIYCSKLFLYFKLIFI